VSAGRGLQVRECLDAAAPGHDHVEQQHIGFELGHPGDRLLDVQRLADDIESRLRLEEPP
jgi:hypothetical protein